ncbi:hypothetical protein FB451DRAFT_1183003 [Mycena latifolia]|nr:hypothetical protein FB451DRAFT_1183003 [Mycena latifolia]
MVGLSAKKVGALEELRASPTARQRRWSGVLAQAVFVLLEQGGQYLGMWQRGVRGCIDKCEVANVWGLSSVGSDGSELEVEGLQAAIIALDREVHAAPMTAGILALSNTLLLVAMRAAHGVQGATGTRAANLELHAAGAALCGLRARGPARRAQDAQSLLGCKECLPSLSHSGTSTPPRYTPRGPHRGFVRNPHRLERTQPRRRPGNIALFTNYFTRHCARRPIYRAQALLLSAPVDAWLPALQRPAMFAQLAMHCVSLPAYPFAVTKFWVPFVANAPASEWIFVEDQTGALPFVKGDVHRQLGRARDEAMHVGELKYLPTWGSSSMNALRALTIPPDRAESSHSVRPHPGGPSKLAHPPAAFSHQTQDLIMKFMEGGPSKRFGNMWYSAADVFEYPWSARRRRFVYASISAQLAVDIARSGGWVDMVKNA